MIKPSDGLMVQIAGGMVYDQIDIHGIHFGAQPIAEVEFGFEAFVVRWYNDGGLTSLGAEVL
jgi:hypothetical protein